MIIEEEPALSEDNECGDCGSMQVLICSPCGSGYCVACAIIGGTNPAKAMEHRQDFLDEHSHA